MTDEEIYAKIADELSTAAMDPGLWTQAIAAADGQDGKTKAAYIKLRFKALRAAHAGAPSGASGLASNASAGAGPSAAEAKLADKLATARKSTLYSALKVSPDATQDEIAAVSQALRERIRAGEAVGDIATLSYALDTLGDPDRRRAYDQSLLRNLQPRRPPEPPLTADHAGLQSNAFLSWWNTRRTLATLVGVGMVVAVGLMLSHSNERAKREVERAKVEADLEKAAQHAANEAARVENERELVQGALQNQASAIEQAARLDDRRINISERSESRRRTELEYRANAGREILDQRRQVVNEQLKQRDWQRQQYERERSENVADRQAAADRAQLISAYLGRQQFLLARDVARTPSEIAMIERAEASARQREAAGNQREAAERRRQESSNEPYTTRIRK